MESDSPPICENCQVRIIVIECPKFERERHFYFRRSPKINIILGEESFNKIKLVGFRNKTNIFNQI